MVLSCFSAEDVKRIGLSKTSSGVSAATGSGSQASMACPESALGLCRGNVCSAAYSPYYFSSSFHAKKNVYLVTGMRAGLVEALPPPFCLALCAPERHRPEQGALGVWLSRKHELAFLAIPWLPHGGRGYFLLQFT